MDIDNVLTILWEQTERKREVYPAQSFWLPISVDQGQGVAFLPCGSSLTSELRLDFGSSRLASVAAWEAKAYGVTCGVGGLPNQSPWLLAVRAGLDKGV